MSEGGPSPAGVGKPVHAFQVHINHREAGDHGLDTRSILIELGKRRMVGGQDDMIVDIALELVRQRSQAPA